MQLRWALPQSWTAMAHVGCRPCHISVTTEKAKQWTASMEVIHQLILPFGLWHFINLKHLLLFEGRLRLVKRNRLQLVWCNDHTPINRCHCVTVANHSVPFVYGPTTKGGLKMVQLGKDNWVHFIMETFKKTGPDRTVQLRPSANADVCCCKYPSNQIDSKIALIWYQHESKNTRFIYISKLMVLIGCACIFLVSHESLTKRSLQSSNKPQTHLTL